MAETAKTINLAEPVEYGEETIRVLEIRKPQAADLWDVPVQNQTMGHMMDLASRLSGQPVSAIKMLGMEDLQHVMEVVGGFMEPGRQGGKRK